MRFALPALAALSIAQVAPAFAQQKVVDTNYGFSYSIPSGYKSEDIRDRVRALSHTENPVHLVINEGTTTRTLEDTATRTTNLQWLSTIQLLILGGGRSDSLSAAPKDMSEKTARDFIRSFNVGLKLVGTNLDYQRSAKVKIGGEDAMAILCNASEEGIPEYFTARLIFMPRKDNKIYLFAFGALNEEYQQKVAAFDKFLTSFKFLKPPGTETAAPKSTPKPTKKK